MRPISANIIEIVDETPTIKTFRLDTSSWLRGMPGQFLMVWVRGVDEIPMTMSYEDCITVQKVGAATEAMFKLKEGDSLGIRGPYGNGWELVGDDILLISGGVGSAPLAPLAEKAAAIGVTSDHPGRIPDKRGSTFLRKVQKGRKNANSHG